MKKLCPDQLGSDGQGSMEECMKLAFENSKILDDSCRSHIAELIEVQHADIHMDPLLHRDCSQDDTKFCADEEHGEHLSCLLDVLERNPSALQVRCREILRSRREMYQAALKVTRLETVQDVVALVKASPQKNYFIGIFLMGIAIIFVGGLFCGRTTKRYRLLKDR
ncbi:unnamed protein product [Meganyctiphanes norvegica]|uniref:Golgi apparatus protein 1 n=1 Tax=Meganyctiphanes norvegica TaxID=48144 RepID=A0AAV2RFC3_MEGNR